MMETIGNRWEKMEGYCSTGQSPQWVVVPVEEEEEEKEEEEEESSRPHCGPGLDSAPNRNEYQEYSLGSKGGRCVGLATLPPSCAVCLEIWEPQSPGNRCFCFSALNKDNIVLHYEVQRRGCPHTAKSTWLDAQERA
jgi:hypothetical protein